MEKKHWKERLVRNRSPPSSPGKKPRGADSKDIKMEAGETEKKFQKLARGRYPVDYNEADGLGEFVCELCDAVMNSEPTFAIHLGGKRHQRKLAVANLSKEVKIEYPRNANMLEIRVGGERTVLATKQVNKVPKIQPAIDKEKQPIIGLNYVTEILRVDKKIEPVYHCSLCPADCQMSSVLGHIIGLKHRTAYMKLHFPDMSSLIGSSADRRSSQSDLAERNALKIEKDHGRGEMIVEQELDAKDLEAMEAMPLTEGEAEFTIANVVNWCDKDRMEFLLFALDSMFEDQLEFNLLNDEQIEVMKNACKKIKEKNLSKIVDIFDDEQADRIEQSLMKGDQSVINEMIKSLVLEVGEPVCEVIMRLVQKGVFCHE